MGVILFTTHKSHCNAVAFVFICKPNTYLNFDIFFHYRILSSEKDTPHHLVVLV